MNNLYNKKIRISLGTDFSNFYPYTIDFMDITKLVCSSNVLYSPVQYLNNKRKSSNYLGFSDIIVFDFDEGWNNDLENLFNQWVGYKVPTKSHLKDKNGIVCERYRIILLLDTPITLNSQEYKRLYKHIMRDLNLSSDRSCVDTGRFYYSTYQPIENCVRLKGTTCFQWQKYNYKDFEYASIYSSDTINIDDFKDIDVSYFSNLHQSKRYPCPLCRLEGLDQKGHHLGFSKELNCITCFFDEEHSKILRRLFNNYNRSIMQNDIEKICDIVANAEKKAAQSESQELLEARAIASRERLIEEQKQRANTIIKPEDLVF